MARIPEFTQRQLASSVQPSAITPGTISAVGAGARAAGRAFETVQDTAFDQLGRIKRQQFATQSAQFNSGLEIKAQDSFTNLTQDPKIKQDPSLLRARIGKEFQKLKNDPEFLQLPVPIKSEASRKLASLESQFTRRAITFEANQSFENNVQNLDQTQTNYEELASNTDSPIDDLLVSFTEDIVPFVAAIGDVAKGEEIQQAGSKAIVEQRVNRFLEQSNFDAARGLIEQDEFGDFFDAKERTALREKINRGEKTLRDRTTKLMKQRFTDPWRFQEAFDDERTSPVDLTNQSRLPALSQILSERMDFIQRKNEQLGINLPLLDKDEEENFLQTVNQVRRNPQEAAALLSNIVGGITDEQQNMLSEQIFAADAPLGVSISLADERPDLAQNILNGAKVIKDKLAPMPASSQLDEAIFEQIADAIQVPQFRDASRQAIIALYADRAFKEADDIKDLDTGRVEDVVEDLFGPKIDVNDSKVFGFRGLDGRFIDEDDFEDAFEDLTEASIMAVHNDVPRLADGTPLPLEDLKDSAQLFMAGDGEYGILLFDEFAVDKNGNRFFLNMKEIVNFEPGEETPPGAERGGPVNIQIDGQEAP